MNINDADTVMSLFQKIVSERQRLKSFRNSNEFSLHSCGTTIITGGIIREEERKPGVHSKEMVQSARDLLRIVDGVISNRIEEAVFELRSKFDIIVTID